MHARTVLPLVFLLILIACTHSTPMIPDGVAISSDGLEIAYESKGSGDTALVFVHCWSCDQEFWREQVDVFAAEYTTVTLDLGGHGRSGTDRAEWSVTGLAEDVRAVVEELELDEVILVGHSMGGPVSLAAAPLMPERVIGVVLVDTVHDAEAVMPEEQIRAITTAFERDFEGSMERFAGMLTGSRANRELVDWIIRRATKVDRSAALGLMKDFATVDEAALLAAVDVPVRAINASPNPPMQPDTAIETNRKYADFDAVTIDGVGHYLQLEAPLEFNRHLRRIVEELAN